jgi:hypothetical protein
MDIDNLAKEIESKGPSERPLAEVCGSASSPSNKKPNQPNAKRERFMALLKSRYGYTNEKAVEELARLLRQFYRTNRSLGIHHGKPNFKHPPVE